jgi:O-antigen/teichoic acid export membrane protein
MTSTVATALIGYLYWVVAAHIYSAHDVGLASALISVMTLTSTFADLGVSSMLIQILPRRKTGAAWSLALNAGLATGTLTSLLFAAIMIVALPFFSSQFAILWHDAAYTIVFIAGVPLGTIATLLDQAFVAERTASNMLVRNAVFALLKLLLLFLLTQLGASGIFSSWVLALAATLILGGILLVTCLGRSYYLTVHGIVRQIRTMFSSLVWHHFINIGGKTPLYMLPVLVTVRLSAADNAYYYTASMVGTFFFMVSASVAVVLFAEGSHTADDVQRKVRSSAVIIGMLLGPAMLIALLGGRNIMSLFGPSYAQHSLLLLRIFTFAAVPDAITNIYVSLLRVQRRLRSAALLNLGMASLALLLAWILLPMLGIEGAGWAFLIAQISGSLVAGVDLIRLHRYGTSKLVGQSDSGDVQIVGSYQPIYSTETNLPTLVASPGLPNFGPRDTQETIINTDYSHQFSQTETKFPPDDMMALLDKNAQTEPQIGTPRWLRTNTSSQVGNITVKSPVDLESTRINRSVERWIERRKHHLFPSSEFSQKLPKRNANVKYRGNTPEEYGAENGQQGEDSSSLLPKEGSS